MAITQTFLLLAPEFGGTKFGPFKGMEIRLGSDPARNDIVLPESLGVLPEHVKLLKQGEEAFVVAPTERSAGVFVWRAGMNRSKQITSPMAVQAGSDSYSADAFSLVTAEGPKFYIIQEIPVADGKDTESQLDKARKKLSGKSMIDEVKRQGIATFLTTRGGANLQRWFTYIKTGAILRPRNIIMGVMTGAGWLFAGGTACTLLSVSWNKAAAEENLEECQNRLSYAAVDVDSPDGTPNMFKVTSDVLKDPLWSDSLKNDPDLYAAYLKKLKRILLTQKAQYDWVYKKKGKQFAKFRKALSNAGMDERLLAVVPYASALPGPRPDDREWDLVVSSAGDACGRGPLALTYRQAFQLGIEPLQFDVAIEENKYSAADTEDLLAKLKDTHMSIVTNDEPNLEGVTIAENAAEAAGGLLCVYTDGEDGRAEAAMPDLAKTINAQIGKGARGYPTEGTPSWITNRLAKLFAADMTRGFKDIDAGAEDGPTAMMDEAKNPDATKFVVASVAEVLARSVAIPCMAVLDREQMESNPPTHMGDLPNIMMCINLVGMAQYDLLK